MNARLRVVLVASLLVASAMPPARAALPDGRPVGAVSVASRFALTAVCYGEVGRDRRSSIFGRLVRVTWAQGRVVRRDPKAWVGPWRSVGSAAHGVAGDRRYSAGC